MSVLAKQLAVPSGFTTSGPLTTGSQLTPGFFDSIFADGLNPFDECFSANAANNQSENSAAGTHSKEEVTSMLNEKPRVLNDAPLPTLNTKNEFIEMMQKALSPHVSPTSGPVQDPPALKTASSASNSPSPPAYRFANTFSASPDTSVTPITSPEETSAINNSEKEQKAATPQARRPAPPSKRARKSVSIPKPSDNLSHKRTLSLPQGWDSTIKVAPQLPDVIDFKTSPSLNLPRGMEMQAKPARTKASFDNSRNKSTESRRINGIFVTERIPPLEFQMETENFNGATFQPINTTGQSAGKKRKKSQILDDEDDDEDMSAGEGEGKDKDKREKFLERNRLAAMKCRKKKKLMNQRLEEKSRLLVHQNRFLQATVAKLRDDVLRLKGMLLEHHDCDHAPTIQYLRQESNKYVDNDSEDPSKKSGYGNIRDRQSGEAVVKSEHMDAPSLPFTLGYQEVESALALSRGEFAPHFNEDSLKDLLLADDRLGLFDDEFDDDEEMGEGDE